MEDKLKNIFDNLNEEQSNELLEQDINFDIDNKVINRIKSSTYKKTGISKRPGVLTKKFIACAAAVALVFSAVFTAGYDNIAAAVQQIIEYIPGFGRVPEHYGSEVPEIKVMKEPVFLSVKGEKVEIYSCWMSVYRDQISISTILRYPRTISLNGEVVIDYDGNKIYRDSELPDYTTDDGKRNREMTYTYTIKNPKTPIDTLTFSSEESKVELAFEKSEDVNAKVISENFSGIVISAIPLNDNRSRFVLSSNYVKHVEGVKFSSTISPGKDNGIKALDEAGNEHEIKRSTSQGSEYYVDGDINGRIVSIRFSKLYQSFTFEKNKSIKGIKFKVPQAGEIIKINKSLDNKLSSIKLRTVERVEPTGTAPYNLMFTYEIKSKIPDLEIFNMALYVEKTGGVVGGRILERYKDGDSYIVKYGVIADEKAVENIVTIVPKNICYWNTLFLDKECILEFR